MDIQEILEEHERWLRGEGGKKADLCGADLHKVNLFRANLRWADLRDANLRRVDLRGANLRGADLRRVDLEKADLQGADLCWADLRKANPRWADLRGADLKEADLHEANLQGANLRAIRANYLTVGLHPAPEGELIGWKKTKDEKIIKLLIPSDAKRSCATTRKFRAEYVKVLEGEGWTIHPETGKKVWYRPGEIVRCDKWDPDRWNECSGGIHFFLTQEEAGAWK